MAYAFNDDKSKYIFVEGRLTTDNGESNSYFQSYSSPVAFDDPRTQIQAHLDSIQIRMSISNLSTSGTMGYVDQKYRPGSPAILTIVRDAAPYKHVGIAVIGTDGKFQYFTEAAGNVQIYGTYLVGNHQ